MLCPTSRQQMGLPQLASPTAINSAKPLWHECSTARTASVLKAASAAPRLHSRSPGGQRLSVPAGGRPQRLTGGVGVVGAVEHRGRAQHWSERGVRRALKFLTVGQLRSAADAPASGAAASYRKLSSHRLRTGGVSRQRRNSARADGPLNAAEGNWSRAGLRLARSYHRRTRPVLPPALHRPLTARAASATPPSIAPRRPYDHSAAPTSSAASRVRRSPRPRSAARPRASASTARRLALQQMAVVLGGSPQRRQMLLARGRRARAIRCDR